MKIVNITTRDIPDAWFQCIYNVLDHGFKYEVQQGSFVGQTRLEFDFVTIYIKKPYSEPYDSMLPQIPEGLNIPNPVEPGYVEQYIPYLMTGEKKPEEDYTYGQRLCAADKIGYKDYIYNEYKNDWTYYFKALGNINQIEHFIFLLKKTPNTNQAILQVGQPGDCLLEDPPCLRHIDMRIKDNQLIFYPYFRSWDLWGGLPANLSGIAVLQKYMADSIGVESGPMVASSKGLHIYGYVEDLAKLRCYKE